MKLLMLGYVLTLDFDLVPNGGEIGIKHRRRRHGQVVRITRTPYGDAQVGVITATADGVVLADWFNDYEGKVGDVPQGFDPNKPANNGNPVVSYGVEGQLVSLTFADGQEIDVEVQDNRAEIVWAYYDEIDPAERSYALATARALLD